MPSVFAGVGSNLGDREEAMRFAADQLTTDERIRNLKKSPVYETEPLDAPGGKYLNAVWGFGTDLVPRDVLGLLREIESKAGRVRGGGYHEPRTLDLDLLAYGGEVVREDGLTVPHPRMHERYFVLKPFCDLSPNWTHPVLKKTVKELLASVERGA